MRGEGGHDNSSSRGQDIAFPTFKTNSAPHPTNRTPEEKHGGANLTQIHIPGKDIRNQLKPHLVNHVGHGTTVAKTLHILRIDLRSDQPKELNDVVLKTHPIFIIILMGPG
jgi:hypothetical protein